MKFENIMKVLGTKRKGQFVRIQSISDLEKDVRAAYKLLWRVEKESTGTYKFGCKLANCKRWQEKEAARTEPKREYTSWNHWKDGYQDMIKVNDKTGREYLHLLTVPTHSNSQVQYFVTNLATGERMTVSKEWLQKNDIMQPSYWTRSNDTETVLIALDNIKKIY